MKLSAQVGIKTAGVLLLCLLLYLILPVELSGDILSVRILAYMLPFIPAIVWTPIFFRLDRGRQVKGQTVVLAFLLGFFISRLGLSPVANVARQHIWGSELISMLSIGSFSLFWGFLAVFLMFGTLRLTLASSESFHDIEDPVLFSFVIGLGFALGTNIIIAQSIETLRTGPFLARVMINSFSYSAFSALVGYGVSRVKFSHISGWRFVMYQVVASIFAGFVYSLDNILRLVSPLGVKIQSLANLLIMAGLSLLVILFLTARLRRKCHPDTEKRESITSKPALAVLLVAVILTGTVGFTFRQPDHITADINGLMLRLPQGSLAYSFDTESRNFQIPWEGESYQLLVLTTKGELSTAIIKYEIGTLEIPPPEDYRKLENGSDFQAYIFREALWENGLPWETIGIDYLAEADDGVIVLRLTGDDTEGIIALYRYMMEAE